MLRRRKVTTPAPAFETVTATVDSPAERLVVLKFTRSMMNTAVGDVIESAVAAEVAAYEAEVLVRSEKLAE
jgi:hypothetical protein